MMKKELSAHELRAELPTGGSAHSAESRKNLGASTSRLVHVIGGRAAVQCMEGIISNDPEEGIYINTHNDTDGNKLNGANK